MDKSFHAIRNSDQLALMLRDLRLSRRMTQQDLAERLGLSQPRIAEIERKPGRISVDQLLKLMQVLGATPYVARGRMVESGGDANVRVTPEATATAEKGDTAPEGEW